MGYSAGFGNSGKTGRQGPESKSGQGRARSASAAAIGKREGPDDPPRRSPPVVIEGKAVQPSPSAPPSRPFVNGTSDLVARYSAPDEPWREYMNANYDPWADNR
jgi:hypothetical protein